MMKCTPVVHKIIRQDGGATIRTDLVGNDPTGKNQPLNCHGATVAVPVGTGKTTLDLKV